MAELDEQVQQGLDELTQLREHQKSLEETIAAERRKNEGLMEEQRSTQAQCEELHRRLEEEKEAKNKVQK